MNTIVNGIIPPEGAANSLFAARSEMQALYLAQIGRQFSFPKQRMLLLAGKSDCMSQPVLVQMIGAPIACTDAVKDSWRGVAQWLTGQLKGHFGEAVQVQYFDLFDTDCQPLPGEAQLPLILRNGTISCGKISVPNLRRKICAILESQMA